MNQKQKQFIKGFAFDKLGKDFYRLYDPLMMSSVFIQDEVAMFIQKKICVKFEPSAFEFRPYDWDYYNEAASAQIKKYFKKEYGVENIIEMIKENKVPTADFRKWGQDND